MQDKFVISSPKPSNLETWFMRVATIIIMLAAIFGIYYMYLIFFPPKIITYSNIPFPVVNSPVKIGTSLVIDISYCKYYDILPSDRTGNLISDTTNNIIEPTLITKKFPLGCHSNYHFNGYIIPVGTPPGIYHIEANTTYTINNIGFDHERYTTRKFQVIP